MAAVRILAGAGASGTSYTGTFAADDDKRVFYFTLGQAGTVTLRTWSYAGGVDAAGAVIPEGGFDPTLSVFDASGNQIAVNEDGGCGTVAADSVTSFCWDSYLSLTLPAGNYSLLLTESANLANGRTLAQSFVYDPSLCPATSPLICPTNAQGDFTAAPGNAAPGFWDFFPSKRTANYAVDIVGATASEITAITSSTTLPSSIIGSTYPGFQFTAQSGPRATLTWSVASGSLPPGLTLNPATGFLSGTGTVAGNYSFSVQVTDGIQPSAPQQVAVTILQTQSITFNTLPNVSIGIAPFAISATASSGLTVTFASNTTSVCTISGATVTAVTPGTCSITASQAGNAVYAAATPVTQSFTVLQTQTITFNSLPNVNQGAAPFTIGATASSGLTVAFASNSTNICTVSVTTVTVLTAGTCSITASQSGNAVYAAATPVTRMFNVLAPQTITLNTVPTQLFGLSPFALSVESNALLPVTIVSQTPAICTTADILVTIVKPGTCTVQASQAGNNNFQPAPSVTTSFTVKAANASGTFNPDGAGFAAGTNPYAVATADFNGDGFADFAVANSGSNSVTVMLGSGTGRFTAAANSPFTAGSQPQSVVTGDFNADGNPDLAIANSGDNTVTILLGDGMGNFTPATGSPAPAGTNPVSLAVGDFNGDGIQDLVVADNSGGTTTLLLGVGNGAFTTAPASLVLNPTNPASVAVGDFNGDGIPDLAIASSGDNTVRVLLGNGTAGFTAAPASPVTVGTGPASVVVGDFNGDGFADFAVANSGSNNVTVMLGDGAGHFAPSAVSPVTAGFAPRALTVFDFNGDKIQDLAVADSTGSAVTVLVGDGHGNFAPPATSPFGVGSAPYAVAVADFNGDGYEDLAVANEGSGTVSVLLGAVVVPPPPPPALTISVSPNPVNVAVGGSVAATFNTGGGTGGYTFKVSGLPSGVTAGSSGFSGSPTQAGTFTATVLVTDSAGDASATSVTINVLGLTTTSLPSGTAGQPYSATLAATGGSGAYTFTATGLPSGISLSGGGTLAGTTTSTGTFNIAVAVTSGGVSATGTFSLTIAKAAPITISSATLPAGKVNAAYSQSFSATGGVPPYTWALANGALPAGLSLSSAGVLSGTPTAPGTFAFGVMATDTSGGTAAAAASLTIQAAPLQFTTQTAPAGMNGVPYPTLQFSLNGGMPPFTFAVTSGSLPSGLTLSSDGVLSGTPQLGSSSSSVRKALIAHAALITHDSGGTTSFTVGITVTDSAGSTATIQLPLSIRPTAPALILTEGTLSFALSNPAQSAPAPQVIGIQSTDPTQILNYTLTVNPAVSWLNVSNGTMTPDSIQASITSAGLALAPGAYNTTITATCTSSACSGGSVSAAVTLTVTALPPLLQVSTNLLSFATTNTATGAPSGMINVSNAGGGTLGFASVSCEAAYCTAGPAPQSLAGGVSAAIPVTINPVGLEPNFYRTQVDISTSGGMMSVPVTLFISANATMTLAPSGTQFNQLQGSAPGFASGSFLVAVNSTTPVNYTASIVSIQNVAAANWLVLQNASGTATSTAPGTVTFSIDPAAASQLPAGVYYAIVAVSSPDVANSPQDYEVVLNVAPQNTPVAPEPSPAGLLFIQSGNGVPAPQTVNVYSASSQPFTYQAAATTVSGGNWLSVTPSTGMSSSTAPGVSTVSVDTSKLTPGVYYGGISYSLSATAVRTVNVTLIIPSAGAASGSSSAGTTTTSAKPHAAGCTPSVLVPAQTGLVNSFSAPAGWPTPLSINLADDCGNLIADGMIVATFTNGDPPLILPLSDQTTGLYTGTWAPTHSASQVTITVAASAQGFKTATSQITGGVAPNPVPVISPTATLHVFDPVVGGALAPGTIIAIYGNYLATSKSSATTIPLPTLYNDASVTIGNFYAPIYYASPIQLNVQVPFELNPGQQYDVFVSVAGKLSTPQPIQLSTVAPGLAAYTSGGLIAQHQADGSLITATSPAVPGEYVQAYLAGLGATTVDVPSGAASPSSPLALPSDMPTLTINGSSYPIYFVGLTPTLVGLYQIDFQAPAGLTAGNLNVAITQNGVSSNLTTLPYQP